MREIKFRAWDKIDKWMDDDFYLHSAGDTFDLPHKLYDTPNTEIEKTDNFIVMQYTGLKDKNGHGENDLYENDICYIGGHGNCIVMIDSCLGVCFKDNEGQIVSYMDAAMGLDVGELVGNMHQNPELLAIVAKHEGVK